MYCMYSNEAASHLQHSLHAFLDGRVVHKREAHDVRDEVLVRFQNRLKVVGRVHGLLQQHIFGVDHVHLRHI